MAQQARMSIKIRPEEPPEAGAIAALTAAAFREAAYGSQVEHLIVAALREAGQLAVSLVAEDSGAIVGHVAVSPVSIDDGAAGWYGLGPISVAPERQRQGIGSLLMQAALKELRRLGAAGCVVLGDPGYYGRFGFKAEPALVLPGVPPEYFQTIAFGDTVPAGRVTYHQAFDIEG